MKDFLIKFDLKIHRYMDDPEIEKDKIQLVMAEDRYKAEEKLKGYYARMSDIYHKGYTVTINDITEKIS